jgi:hypothetical protein
MNRVRVGEMNAARASALRDSKRRFAFIET